MSQTPVKVTQALADALQPAPFDEGRYRNLAAKPLAGGVKKKEGTLRKLKILFKHLLRRKPAHTRPATPIPVQPLSRQALLAAPDNSLWRLGHSTVLIKAQGVFFITDPVFGQRASPVQWAGPLRFHQPPISLEDLPPIKAVILSHNHYDHLDRHAVKHLASRAEWFLAPLGVGDTVVNWGIDASKVRQLGWWDETEIDGFRFAATPGQHFSGRGLHDSNATLWASWVMITPAWRLFFSGDTGYFPGFKQIGERYGPFDITLMETGAYNVAWPVVHMQPEESLRAHLDVKGRCMLPIHNGTFDLAYHPWHEPFDRICALAADAQVAITTPQMGERVQITEPAQTQRWW